MYEGPEKFNLWKHSHFSTGKSKLFIYLFILVESLCISLSGHLCVQFMALRSQCVQALPCLSDSDLWWKQ